MKVISEFLVNYTILIRIHFFQAMLYPMFQCTVSVSFISVYCICILYFSVMCLYLMFQLSCICTLYFSVFFLYPIFQFTDCICILYLCTSCICILCFSVMYLYPIFQCTISILCFSVMNLYPIFQFGNCICIQYFNIKAVTVTVSYISVYQL